MYYFKKSIYYYAVKMAYLYTKYKHYIYIHRVYSYIVAIFVNRHTNENKYEILRRSKRG